MPTSMTAGQQALLASLLEQRQRELDRTLDERQGGLSRAEHARAVLTADSDDLAHRDDERELDLARSDREIDELGEVCAALLRLRDGRYGDCEDCAEPIPLDRLHAEPWARRCLDCASRHERSPR